MREGHDELGNPGGEGLGDGANAAVVYGRPAARKEGFEFGMAHMKTHVPVEGSRGHRDWTSRHRASKFRDDASAMD